MLFGLALFGSGGGLLLFLLTDFGGWYNYYYYAGYREWNYIGISSPISVAGLLVLGLPFLICAITAIKALQNPASVMPKQIKMAFTLSIVQLVIILLGAVIFVALVSGSDDWWFGTGFYASTIGAIISLIAFSSVRRFYPMAPSPSGYVQSQPGYYPQQPQQATPQQSAWSPAPPSTAPPPPAQAATSGSQVFCQNCGARLAAAATFCEKCGRRVS